MYGKANHGQLSKLNQEHHFSLFTQIPFASPVSLCLHGHVLKSLVFKKSKPLAFLIKEIKPPLPYKA